MKYVPYALAAIFVLAGITAVVCRLLRGPSVERVVEQALDDDGARERYVGRAVVAGDDLAWQVDLARIYADYDTYRTELRLPGERAS